MITKTRNILLILFWLAAFLLLATGLSRLFVLRFQRGDIFPVYSSLRSDPLGTKVLYDSLSLQPKLRVERNYESFDDLEPNTNTTLIIAGASPWVTASGDLRSYVMQGGRLVILYYPRSSDSLFDFYDDDTNKCCCATNRPANDGTTNLCDAVTNAIGSTLAKKSRITDGLSLGRIPLTNDLTAIRASDVPLPTAISCHSALCFTNITNSWSIVYERDGFPVIIEQALGRGSVVLSTLSFFISNEAMRDERYPRLLHWLTGNRRHIIFDEYHNELRQSVHMSDFIAQYHLQWFVFAALIPALLYIWRNSTSLVPPRPDSPRGMTTELRSANDSFNGLINLLRRSIPKNRLLKTCFDEWSRPVSASRYASRAKTAQIEHTISSSLLTEESIPQTYNKCCAILKQRTKAHGENDGH